MKIGILSMQRIINYGSFLQAYSLKENIKSLGMDVEFVDYKVEQPVVLASKQRKQNKYINKVEQIFDQIKSPRRVSSKVLNCNLAKMYSLEAKYYTDYFDRLGLTKEKNLCPKVDTLVIGSDEVFNCIQPSVNVGYSKQLFGAERNSKRLISYAGSFGNTTVEGLEKYHIKSEVAGLLNEFDAISIRDKNSESIVKTLTGKEPECHLDPVFLYDFEHLMPNNKQEKGYIVLYSYACRIKKKEAAAIKKFAKRVNKNVVCLSGVQFYFEDYRDYAPFEMLEFIKNADYVITDTFHGTVFSIKYNKKFAVFVRDGYESAYGNNEKLVDLLKRFNLENRIVDKSLDITSVMEKEIPCEKINHKLMEERKRSIDYLKRNL